MIVISVEPGVCWRSRKHGISDIYHLNKSYKPKPTASEIRLDAHRSRASWLGIGTEHRSRASWPGSET